MTEPRIVLFDGVCNLCVGSVQFIIRHDPERVFRFASLQSEVGRALSRRYDIVAGNLETMVLIGDNTAFTRSEAAIRIACEFGGIWRLARGLRLIPLPLRDVVYDWVARHRYRWFGSRTECWLPSADLQTLFLDHEKAQGTPGQSL